MLTFTIPSQRHPEFSRDLFSNLEVLKYIGLKFSLESDAIENFANEVKDGTKEN